MDDEIDLSQFPQSPKQEFVVTAARFLVSFLPVGGGAAVELLNALAPVMSERRIAWLEYVGRAAKRLHDQVEDLDPERLFQRPEFTSTFLQASQIAMRTHQREKLEALRNAVLNVAVGTALEDDIQLVLLNLLDVLSPTHIRLLKLFVEPEAHGIQEGVHRLFYPSPSDWEAVQRAVPSLNGQRESYHFYVNDLVNRGLLTRADTNPRVPAYDPNEPLSRHPTGLAYQLLAFIASPPADDPNDAPPEPEHPQEAPHEQA